MFRLTKNVVKMWKIFWIYVILFQLNFSFGIQTSVAGPLNAAVVGGQRMDMKCQVDIDLIAWVWSFKRSLTSEVTKLFTMQRNQSITGKTHLEVYVNDFYSGVLYANSTKLDHAGIYICTRIHNGRMPPQEYSAHLIVFETEPNCTSNHTLNPNTTVTEEITVRLRCTVNFRGYLVPDVEWRKREGYEEKFEEGEEMTNLADKNSIMNSRITSGLTVVLSSNTSSLSYSCKIYFRSVNESQVVNAKNAPNYSYTYIWNMPAVDISSTNLQIELTIVLISVVVSLAASVLVVAIVGCICRKKYRKGQSVEKGVLKSMQGTTCTGPFVSANNDAQNSRSMKYFGDDGTEYMEMNAMGRQQIPVRLPDESNVFSVVGEYAFLDHTLSPPIPPRDKKL